MSELQHTDKNGVLDATPESSTKSRTVFAGALVSATVTLFFLLLFWNRFLGLRSGDGGYTGGLCFLKGILPFRDYFAAVPPLYTAHCAAVLTIFGRIPIALRGFAVFERVALSLLLYSWLVRFFRVKDAALATLVTMVVSAGDYADPVSSYNHFTIMIAIASGFVASYALDEERSARALAVLGSITGVLSLLCLGAKQTVGIGVTVAVPTVVVLCLIRLAGVGKALRFLFGFAVGWVVAAGTLLGWMAHLDILRPFLVQAFVTGPKAKASHPGDFVFRFLAVLIGYWWAALIACVVLLVSWAALRRSENEEAKDSFGDSLKGVGLALLLGIGAIGVSSLVILPIQVAFTAMPAKPTIYISLVGSGLLVVYYVWRCCVRGSISGRQSQFALLATVSFVIAFMLSLSYPAFEAMSIPGLGLFLAVLLNDFRSWRRWIVYAACVVLLFFQTQEKLRVPFGFNGWFEPPVKTAVNTSSLPELRGFLLPPDTVDFVDSTVRIIRENSTPQDTIFIYPELGIFYGLTGRRPATFSASHNIDVVSDALAREEAQRLLRARPAVLIYGPTSEALLNADELTWRNGNRSELRTLTAAVEALAHQYKFVKEFSMYPAGEPVYVFVRPDALQSGNGQ